MYVCLSVCVCACVRACVRACVHARVCLSAFICNNAFAQLVSDKSQERRLGMEMLNALQRGDGKRAQWRLPGGRGAGR